jgi:hypothetical protein
MTTLDTTEVGIVAAKVMEDLDRAASIGELGERPAVIAAAVIYEVRGTDDDGDATSVVGLRVTDDRNVLGLGLLARANEALLRPDGDLTGD